MKRDSYRNRDYAFGQRMLTLRTALMLTQSGLANVLGVSRNTVADWEAGSKYPRFENLKTLIEYATEHRAFPAGREADEIRALWQAARQKVLLDDAWLAALLAAPAKAAPAARTPEAPHHLRRVGIPFQPTSFVGRNAEIAEIARILSEPACRLLTLIGPGGAGKTRLAAEVAASHGDTYTDGAAFVSLAPVSAPGQIVSAIGDTLQLSFGSETDPAAHLIAYLRDRHLLLVLDNFEHVLDGAGLVYDILERAPQVTLLITSRERLNLRAEWLFDVQGLAYPLDSAGAPSSPGAYSAVQLFIQRATQVHPGFPLPETTLRRVVDICQHVAGMPLAIELAAASVRVMTVEEIDRQISQNLDILATSLYDVPARHRSLRAVFEHSWNLMSETERAAFTWLGVFRGGFTAEAASQVAGAALPTLLALADKSMVRQASAPTDASDAPRFFLLEPIREYALQKLDAPALDALRRAHARYFQAMAQDAQAQWETLTAESALRQLDRENDNLRAALQWTASGGDAMLGLRMVEALVRYWRSRVYLDEARQWLEMLLALNQHEDDEDALLVRMRTTYAAAMIYADRRDYTHAGVLFEQSHALRHQLGAGGDEMTMLINEAQLARNVGEYRHAAALLEESLVRYRAVGDLNTFTSGGYGFVLYFLAHMLREQGDYQQAQDLYLECRQFHVSVGDREAATQGLLGLSDIARDTGDSAAVRRYCAEALLIYREFGTQWAIGFCINNLALAAYQEHQLDEAYALISESVAMFREQKSPGSIAEVLVTLGRVLAAQGKPDEAQAALTESLRVARITGPRLLIAAALEALGYALAQRGDAGGLQAARYLAVAEALRERMGTPLRPTDQPAFTRTLAAVRDTLGGDTFAAAWAEARQMPFEQVVSEIIGAR